MCDIICGKVGSASRHRHAKTKWAMCEGSPRCVQKHPSKSTRAWECVKWRERLWNLLGPARWAHNTHQLQALGADHAGAVSAG